MAEGVEGAVLRTRGVEQWVLGLVAANFHQRLRHRVRNRLLQVPNRRQRLDPCGPNKTLGLVSDHFKTSFPRPELS